MADYQHGSATRDPWADCLGDASALQLLCARKRLHELTQAVTLVVGAAELLPIHPAGSPERDTLESELSVAAQLLKERTERLRTALLEG